MNPSPEALATQYINLGVSHFECGQVDEAVDAFAAALATSKQLLRYDEDEAENMLLDDGPFQPLFGKSDLVVAGPAGLSIFLNPIKLPDKLPSTKVYKTLSLITMFNLAICHHRNAIQNNMNRAYLRKALQLYELAYSIQVQGGIDMTLTPTMIIMSNVGHIHKCLGNTDNALQCFQHLLSTLMFLVEAGERERVWEFDGFFCNIMKTIYADTPAAAA